ncbi:tyrosine-type recombinase/integrase [Agrobacterium vitis]|uniref:tyrosine-type recombinase/integrase n=1 Tax=Rhizobium/Agrobacterium group TaxID=227290 RepID=UPI0012E7E67C|nr:MULTISPECIES: tyrosine-type recombinase/integrase [Rhizobium/Agrobacterium group]MCF1496259.1 tyrosine-type recombinase/integrase [Allorhizobium ampelinum]MVA48974.1 tyrosine-type recombinase/integrase [Agrobacterium vitis]
MKVRCPGLIKEELPSGNIRYRVRVIGKPKQRIRIFCLPADEDFSRQYTLARYGEQPAPLKKASEAVKPGSIGWLVHSYFEHMEQRVNARLNSAKTLKKKRNLLIRISDDPDRVMIIPQTKLIEMQDKMASTPAQADAFIEAISVMYDWAIKRGYIKTNPAKGIERIYKKGDGATPWKSSDVNRFIAHHKPGSKPFITLSILLWTGCRIGDLTFLGPRHECIQEGLEALRWVPAKKGSSEVTIPLLKPLKASIYSQGTIAETYIVARGNKPFASGDSMSAVFKRWCVDAGLNHLSAHGVRKGLAELLAEQGCSQYEIMAILGHSQARTSEAYTRRVERWKLAQQAMDRLDVSRAWL